MTDNTNPTSHNGVLFEQMRAMHSAWLERLSHIREIESDYGARLLHAKNPVEASAICHEWMAKRLESLMKDQQAFTAAWLRLVSDTTQPTTENPPAETRD